MPVDEQVHWPLALAVELYTSTHFADLLKRITASGWDDGADGMPPGYMASELRKWRQVAAVGAWVRITEIGVLGSNGTRKSLLPEGFKSIILKAYCLGPSVTALVAEVRLDTKISDELTLILKKRHPPRVAVENGRRVVLDGDRALERCVEEYRDNIESRVQSWLSEELPGIFSEGRKKRNETYMPVISCIFTEKADPFDLGQRSDVVDMLDLASLEAWKCIQYPQLILTKRREPFNRKQSDRYIISGRLSDIIASPHAGHSGSPPSLGSAAWFIGEYIGQTVACRIAIESLLDQQFEAVGNLRDWAHDGMRRNSRRSSLAMRDLATTVIADSTVALTDLRYLTDDADSFHRNLANFEAVGRARTELVAIGAEDYFEWLRSELSKNMARFREQHDNIKGLLELSATFNIELHSSRNQMIASLVAFMSLAVALVALAVSATDESLLLQYIRSLH